MATTTASAEWIGGERFATFGGSGHALVLDGSGDTGTAPTPMEAALRALCACTAVDVLTILRKKRQPVERLLVSADAERAAEAPRVYTRIEVQYRIAGMVDRKAAEDAIRLSETKYCSVSLMIGKTATITSQLLLESAPAAAGRS